MINTKELYVNYMEHKDLFLELAKSRILKVYRERLISVAISELANPSAHSYVRIISDDNLIRFWESAMGDLAKTLKLTDTKIAVIKYEESKKHWWSKSHVNTGNLEPKEIVSTKDGELINALSHEFNSGVDSYTTLRQLNAQIQNDLNVITNEVDELLTGIKGISNLEVGSSIDVTFDDLSEYDDGTRLKIVGKLDNLRQK